MSKFTIIDADAHVIETDATWSYMEKSEKRFRPILYSSQNTNNKYWVLDDKIVGVRFPTITEQEAVKFSNTTKRNMNYEDNASDLSDINMRIKHMDSLGIDIQILHNTFWIEKITNNEKIEVALSASWNNWMIEQWKLQKNRLFWSCVFPTLNIPIALEQIKICKQHGAVAIFMRGYEGNFANIDPRFYPIFELASELNMPIILHAANGNEENSTLLKNYPGGYVINAFSIFRIPVMIACYNLMMSEVPKLFPKLRWGFVEATSQWVPWVYSEVKNRLLEEKIILAKDVMDKNSIFVSCQSDDDLPWIFNYSTENTIVVGTDYGHYDPASDLFAVKKILDRKDINQIQKRKILCDNPKRLYGL
jgi:predicted TIM-barrel fold metal-dependent hydrolase